MLFFRSYLLCLWRWRMLTVLLGGSDDDGSRIICASIIDFSIIRTHDEDEINYCQERKFSVFKRNA